MPIADVVSIAAQSAQQVSEAGTQVSIWTFAIWSAAAALITGVLATLMTRNLKLAEFRQDWINDMRAEIADYFVASDLYFAACLTLRSGGADPAAPATLDEAKMAVTAAKAKADAYFYRINLRINPTDNENSVDDSAFLESLALLTANMDAQLSVSEKQRTRYLDEAMCQSRMLLKREWEVVKGMRPIRSWYRDLSVAMKQGG